LGKATPRRLTPVFLDKIWGNTAVEPWFAATDRKIGEVWFQNEPELPLLVKFIFTSERLSVQVHPDDEQARARGLERGKTEMWHILRADPGAQIGLGLRQKVDVETARQAALDGTIVDLIRWIDVHPGESYLVSAGTVHALGAGLVVCEIQQTSDTTYRLFDYGRPRELHLDEGLAVSRLEPWRPMGELPSNANPPWRPITRSAYFEVFRGSFSRPLLLDAVEAPFSLYIFTEGRGYFGGERYHAGECWLAEGDCTGIAIEPARSTTVLRAVPVGA
jgi:mannose-6-phosphate isomerase